MAIEKPDMEARRKTTNEMQVKISEKYEDPRYHMR